MVSDLNKNFGGSTDLAKKRHGSADLHTLIHPSFLETAVKAQVLTMVDSSKFAVNQFSLRAQCRLR